MKKQEHSVRAGLSERLLNLLFPARCLLCGTVVPAGKSFCRDCAKELPETPFQRRISLPGAGAEGFRIVSPLSYAGGFRKTLYRYKFRGERALAKPLGQLMAEAVRKSGESFEAVRWVPITKNKTRQRGYDQSELLAKSVAKALGAPCLPLLEKMRETETQHELSRKKRAQNVKNAYGAASGTAGKEVLLVDDIVTTGSTLKECAGTLYKAGAKRVLGLCVADAREIKMEEGTEL